MSVAVLAHVRRSSSILLKQYGAGMFLDLEQSPRNSGPCRYSNGAAKGKERAGEETEEEEDSSDKIYIVTPRLTSGEKNPDFKTTSKQNKTNITVKQSRECKD